MESSRIHVLMACHNRRSLTVASVQALVYSSRVARLEPVLYLFDDGSDDGSAEAVAALPLDVRVIRGTGDAYWARSMAQVETIALQHAEPNELVLWLNDDTNLYVQALSEMLDVLRQHHGAVCCGVTRASNSISQVTYGGLCRSGSHPLNFSLLGIKDVVQEVDAMNGNIVMMQASVIDRVGGIDGDYAHAWADIDFALRARKQGVPVLQCSGVQGECDRNPVRPRDTFWSAYRHYRSRKGAGESASLKRLLRVAAPRTWPIFYAWSTVAFAVKWCLESRTRPTASRND